jgi:hypothetical protein
MFLVSLSKELNLKLLASIQEVEWLKLKIPGKCFLIDIEAKGSEN